MRIHAELPKHFWEDIVNTTMYLINIGPSVPLKCEIPEEAWTGKKVNPYFWLYLICPCGARSQSKLNLKFKRCIFIGYGTSEYGYWFWDPKNQKILRHKDVVFNKKKMYMDLLTVRNTSEKDPRVASWSTLEQQDALESKFMELDDVPVKKVRSISEGNEKF